MSCPSKPLPEYIKYNMKNSLLPAFVPVFSLSLCSGLLSACNLVGEAMLNRPASIPNATDPGSAADIHQDPAYKMTEAQIVSQFSNVSCNPLDEGAQTMTGSASSYQLGLRGVVHVPPRDFLNVGPSSDWTHLDSYIGPSTVLLPNQIFISNFNVPTRAFDKGFPTMNGDLVIGADEQPLIEWFRLDFAGYLHLEETDEAGDYEFAVIADDGVSVKLGNQEIIRNDRVTPSYLSCTTQTVSLAKGMLYPIEVAYFQGPRYHIALQMLWRKKIAGAEPLCGSLGNDLFYDSTKTPSEPTANYQALLSRGWATVPPPNFTVPDGVDFNPCMSERVQDIFSNM